MHKNFVIHCDIKPGSFLFQNSKELHSVKLSNFSMATFFAENSMEMKNCGTPGYIAPEVIHREGYGPKIDIYSCGVILYTLLTGTAPFSGKSLESIMEKNTEGKIEFSEIFWGNVSEEARNLTMMMLETDQFLRPSAEECLAHPWFKKNLFNLFLSNASRNLATIKFEPGLNLPQSEFYMKSNFLFDTIRCLNRRKPSEKIVASRLFIPHKLEASGSYRNVHAQEAKSPISIKRVNPFQKPSSNHQEDSKDDSVEVPDEEDLSPETGLVRKGRNILPASSVAYKIATRLSEKESSNIPKTKEASCHIEEDKDITPLIPIQHQLNLNHVAIQQTTETDSVQTLKADKSVPSFSREMIYQIKHKYL